MPRGFTGYEPDQIDCQNLTSALGTDFGVLCKVVVQFSADEVVVIGKCFPIAVGECSVCTCQAIVRTGIKLHRSLYVPVYSVLLDCCHQMDRGVLGASTRPIERGWSGRPQTPRRRT